MQRKNRVDYDFVLYLVKLLNVCLSFCYFICTESVIVLCNFLMYSLDQFHCLSLHGRPIFFNLL